MQAKIKKRILLVGNPNVGKSTLFNTLCHTNQKTGNYAGVTVASLAGNYTYRDEEVEVIDLPGAYSIYPSSEDEAVFSDYLIQEEKNYCGVVYTIEALSIKRGLLMLQQIQDLGIPMVLVINQIDQTEKRGISLNIETIEKELGVKVYTTNAKKGIGVENLRQGIYDNLFSKKETISFDIPMEQRGIIEKLSAASSEPNLYRNWVALCSNHKLIDAKDLSDALKHTSQKRMQVQETIRRYQDIDKIIKRVIVKKANFKELLTEKLDRILVHKFWGYIIFLLLLLVIFQSVFTLAQYPMDWIESLFDWLAGITKENLPDGPLSSLVADGILPGVGGVVVFAPQIGILLYFLYLLEDSGYMARVIFLMDRFLRPFGLNGKSIVPLVSGTACAIPAIMAARNIENMKERLITIIVTPFMTCSARLPIYSIIISLVIPSQKYFGISLQAITLLIMYLLGFVMVLLSSLLLKTIIKTKEKSFLVMDLPTYKMPLWGYDLKMTLKKVWAFITGAGKIIFAVSIIIWVLSYFGPSPQKNEMVASNVELENSYLAKMGRGMEPIIKPLGYNWKMGVSIITSFAAREVFVGTMSTLYSLNDEAPEEKIIDRMKKDQYPDGSKVFTLASGASLLIYYAFAMQCISTIAVVYKETKSIRWTLIQLLGMTGLAYIASFFVFQLFK
ncbi:ferrous iron transport protein B [Riemerella columbipharyngis]|uniref:Ferrous iron transport protein B n=2 Tax=Riemerella columbipharyngis TaxID=1071918 RepID=A0A1G7B743_9FLAO|nr:ferrous iron transport protein B [Riemerella columbipharyngis]SDE22687.1 ferrous iron transport protein B [Riemerella columbipharyngis]